MLERTDLYVKLTIANYQVSKFARLVTAGNVTIGAMFHEPNDVVTPFHPLKIEINGTLKTLPLTLPAGKHIIQYIGAPIEGKGLLLTGHNMGNVESLEIFEVDPDNDIRSGSTAVIQGINTITFRRVDSIKYNIPCYIMNADGIKSETSAVPVIPPFPDSRTKTSVNVDCAEAGTLYWTITPHK